MNDKKKSTYGGNCHCEEDVGIYLMARSRRCYFRFTCLVSIRMDGVTTVFIMDLLSSRWYQDVGGARLVLARVVWVLMRN